jgi:tetrahydromethanopterin S-methyltransferase subunit F
VTEAVAWSAQEKEQFLRSAVEDILIGADRVNSVEHSILVQVEAATLLWEFDRDRANSVLGGAVEKFRGLLEKESDAKPPDTSAAEKERVRASILRKVARLNPNLLKELIVDKADGEKNRPAIVTNWTEEARAILAVADEEIDRNPAFAAKLALKSLSFGTVSLPSFLRKLARRDRPLAEQQAMILLSQLRDSSVSPLYLLGFANFVFFDDKGPAQLRDYYFESVAIRIRRGVRPDVDARDVEDLINAARAAGQQAKGYPRWQAEFAQIVSDFESLLAARSLPVPGFPSPRAVEMPKAATEGDTRDIAEAAERVENIRDWKVRDKEYKKLAVSAANKADVKLAEKLVSKIEDEDARRKASIDIYSPFVRRALAESDWAAARMYALKVADPLGRSLVVDWVAQKMTGAKQDKELVKELYDAALAQLRHDSPTRDVALGFLALGRSIFAMDRERSLDAMRWAVYVLNKAGDARPSSGSPELAGELGTWVRQGSMLRPEETLDMTEVIGPAFHEMGKRDFNEALGLASGLSDQGLSLMARVGVVRTLVEEVRNSKKLGRDGKQTSPK